MEIIGQLVTEVNQKYSVNMEFALDGKIHRKDHVWAVGNSWFYNNKEYTSINYGSWKYADQYTVKSWPIGSEDKKFKKAYAEKTNEQAKILKEEKEKKHADCKTKWEPLYRMALGYEHEYLTYKGIKNHNANVNKYNELLIPFYNENGFVGVQRIDKDGKKLFSSGIEIQGAISPLKDFKDSKICYLSEGFATAATIQEIFPDIPSICAANAGNLIHAVKTIRKINPDIKICIAADNDKNNIGENKAKMAASSDRDIIYYVCKFSTPSTSWTDFNDLAQFESPSMVRDQLSITEDNFANIKCLGHNEDVYYYSSSMNKQIIELKQGAHNKSGLKHIMSMESYWYRNYGIKDDEGNFTGISWDKAEFDLKEKSQRAGIFNPRLVRGTGLWKDYDQNSQKDVFVLNDGQSFHGKPDTTKFHYQKLAGIDYDLKTPMYDCFDMQELLYAVESLSFKNPKENIYLAAWIIQAQIFACIPWRFHLWVTGQRGSGKSSIIELVGELIHEPNFTPNSTAAGIRQELHNNARPTLYDESEADDKKIGAVIEMARQMSSNNGAQTLRGTSSGKSIAYNTQTVFMFGSIQIPKLNAADQSRIFITEMVVKNNATEYKKVQKTFHAFSKNKNKLFNRAYSCLESILTSIETIKDILRDEGMEARQADQIASMLACFHVYHDELPIDHETTMKYLEKYDLRNSEYIEENKEDEAEKCLDAILSLEVDNYGRTIMHCINNANVIENERMLASFGMKLVSNKDLFIATKSHKLIQKLKEYPDYVSILRRNEALCIKRHDAQNIADYNDKTVRGIRITSRLQNTL